MLGFGFGLVDFGSELGFQLDRICLLGYSEVVRICRLGLSLRLVKLNPFIF